MTFTRITVDPRQMGSVPCIRGLRIPVATVVEMVADGMRDEEILAAPTRTSKRKTYARLCVTLPSACGRGRYRSSGRPA